MNFVIPDDYDKAYLGSPHVERLIPHGKVRVYSDPPRDEGELVERLRPAEIVIPIRERTPFTAERLVKLPNLRLISMTGTGVASIDLEAATARRVVVTNTPGTSVPAVVELAFGLMIALCRRLPAIDREIREGGWPQHVGSELSGKTLGIIGLGAIGSRVADVARQFGMEVLAWSPRLTADRARQHGVTPLPLADLMARADFVSVHARSLPATKGLMSRELIGLRKPGAFFINTARAAIVDEDALWEALDAGRLAGAGLDVFSQEPLPQSHRWTGLPNVVLTSHRGWVTQETLDRFMGGAVENVLAFLAGRPVNVVNPDALQ
ncbi:MAG: D-2-hydroxyacid dehydrogenase family protein [Candidatus Rokubacteria bacterium]|nr:D-2-hydroxyacid dehydrogenase family protein [Candidatus Rokubacteria bacterium]